MSVIRLIDAFKDGNERLAQRLFDSKPDAFELTTFQSLVYDKPVGKVSLLHLAAYWGWQDFIERLVASHGDAIKDDEGHIPLHYASYNGHLDLVKYFITARGCNPIAENDYQSTPLHLACINGQLNVVHYLTRLVRCNPSCKDDYGDTPLHYACSNGHLNIARYLISKAHCNPSCVNSHTSDTPLHHACSCGHLHIVQYLVSEAHCDPSCVNTFGETPLHRACSNGHLNIVQYLISEANCNPSCENTAGNTPLHRACINCHLNIVRYLVSETNCNPSCENAAGNTPLHDACINGHLNIVQYFISEAHCNPSYGNNKDRSNTPLDYACISGHLNIVQYLISEANCNPSCENAAGNTPLYYACINGHLNIVQYLVREAHCNPSYENKYSITPLHYACDNGHLNIVQYLIREAHCNPSCENTNGSTPLHYACMRGHAHIVQYLLSTGCVNPLAKDKYDQTPLFCAVNKYDIVKLFQPFIDCSRDFPVHTFIKLILIGDGGAGKTTLAQLIIQASQTCSTTPESLNFFGRAKKKLQGGDRVAEVQHFTAGIVPHHVKSEQLGNFVMYDFAGQQAYFSSHAAVLEQVMRRSAAMFVCMIDLSKSSKQICESLHYWLSFIENACSTTDVKSYMAIVGSHADKALFTRNEKSSLLQEIAASRMKRTRQEYAGYTAMDCRRTNTPDSDRFISVLTDTHKAIAASQPAINFHCHLLYAFLHTKLEVIGCTLHDLILAISKEKDSSLPNDPSVLSELLTTLSDKGLILFIQQPQSSWIVVKTEALLKEINGTLFAPGNFKEHRDLSSNTGIVPASNLQKAFPEHKLEMLIGFLESLDFCRPVDPSVLQYTNLQTTLSHSTDDLFFFPGLVRSQRPDSLTKHGTLQFGWCLGCVDRNQFFGSRFLHLLLLFVAYQFPLDIQIGTLHGLQRKCIIWKTGILWINDDKITTVVELIDRNRWVLVAMSCSEDRPVEHAKLRSALISLVCQLQQERCSSLEVCEYLVSPNLVQQYPFDHIPKTNRFDIKHVAMSIILHKPTISNQSNEFINHLSTQSLPLEPYQLISPSSVCDLFDSKMADQPVPAPLLQKVQEKICQFRRIPQVYKQLREYLDSMSIFAGRNPLEVAELKEEEILGVYSPTTGTCGHSSILSIADLDEVKTFLNDLVDWQSLGLKLGLLYPTLKKIRIDNSGIVDQCKIEMLAAWLKQQYNVQQHGSPSWSVLQAALRNMGENYLASEIGM